MDIVDDMDLAADIERAAGVGRVVGAYIEELRKHKMSDEMIVPMALQFQAALIFMADDSAAGDIL